MFKYRLILLSTMFLFGCEEPKKTEIKTETKVDRHESVINKTDSLISYAEGKLGKIKENNKQKLFVMDSLQQTIELEQRVINDLNREVRRIKVVDEDLQLTKKELEKALIRCKEKEEKLVKLTDSLDLVRKELTNEKVTLVNYYTDKIKTLEKKIELLNDKLYLIEVTKEEEKKKKKKRRNGKNN